MVVEPYPIKLNRSNTDTQNYSWPRNVFEPPAETGKEHFACKVNSFSQTFKL